MAQPKNDPLLVDLLSRASDPILQRILSNTTEFQPQIIYTRIDRDKKNRPSFRNYYLNYSPDLYYNPASMVKLPAAILSLEKLKELNIDGLDKFTTALHDSTYEKQTAALSDSSSADGLPSIAHYIKRSFLISENDPYNRMYQFLGQEEFNTRLHRKGYTNTRITRQFMGFTAEQNRHTNGIRFYNQKGDLIYHQPPAYSQMEFKFPTAIKVGRAHMSNGKLIEAPFDFTEHNNQPLEDYQQILQSLIFPNSVPAKKRFDISEADRLFLMQYLSQYPSETNYPKYDPNEFYDSYVKFFFRDQSKQMPVHIRVFNKVGWAYGYLTDVSYVVDTLNKVEYMLAATVYTNTDGILNDGKYDYDELGYPFLRAVGKVIYDHELQRPRKNKPDLKDLILNYEARDPRDRRPVISVADN